MKILALEFSSDTRSVALAEKLGEELRILASASEAGGRSTRAFSLIESTLHQAGLEREAVEAIAIGIGPGSYTGIRAAIAVAQGWQLGSGVKTFAISSVAGLALQAQSIGIHGSVAIVVDAQGGDFYIAGYEIGPSALKEVNPLKIVPRSEVEIRRGRGERIIGPDAACFTNGQILLPEAGCIAGLAFVSSPILAEQLEPIYLRETSFVKAPPPRIIP